MRHEVFELLLKMDQRDITTRMALQCAPVIAGLKVSNLLTIPSEDDSLVGDILNGTGLSYRKLAEDKGRSVFLIYRKKELLFWILRRSNQMVLKSAGLSGYRVEKVLDEVQIRYRSYISEGGAYPHEIGILLGYPAEDVKGFVVNKGRNFLASGYWKVYSNPSEAEKVFSSFDRAKERMIEMVARGVGIRSMISQYKTEISGAYAA